MEPKQSLKQQTESLRKTLEYVNEVHFNKESKPASKQLQAGTLDQTPTLASGRRIAEVNKALSEGNVEQAREIIRNLLKVDPANSHLTSLLNKSDISPEELQKATEDFADAYHVRLQDEYNNARLAEAREAELAKQQPSADESIDETEGPIQQQPEQQFENQQPSGGEDSSGQQSQQLPQRQPPPRIMMTRPLTNKERFGTKEAYGEYKEENKEARSERARKLWEDRRKSGMTKEDYGRYKEENKDDRNERAKKLWDRRKASLLRPKPTPASGGFNPLTDWLGKKIAQSRFAQPILKGLESLAERMGLNPVLNGFKALNNLLEWPERMLSRLAGQAARAGLNLGLQAGRALLSGLTEGAGAVIEGASAVTGTVAGIGSALVATGGLGLVLGTFLFITLVLGIVYLFDLQSHNVDCNKPLGEMKVNKRFAGGTGASEGVGNGERIDYIIEMTYELSCQSRKLGTVEVTDKIPNGTKLVTAEEDSTRKPRSGFYGGFGSTGDTGPDGVYDSTTDTISWTFTNFPTQNPVYIYFSVIPGPGNNDSWVMNQAIVRYTTQDTSGGGFPATQDNCNGSYQLNNPIGNFGDPNCDFKKDDLYTLLKQQDPRNADFWFLKVVRCESSYNPNDYRDHNILPQTPDPAGAWGLFQMGRGRNGQYDHGDVDWRLQTTNAVTYAKSVPSIAAYWACARI